MKKLVDKKVAVIGAGFVGLAHSLILASKYAEVVLFDRKEPLIKDLKGGKVSLLTEDESLIELAETGIKNGTLRPSSEISDLDGAQIIFIAIGLDFYETNNGYDNLQTLCTSLVPNISSNTLLVFESTLPPGTIDKFVIPKFIEKGGRFNNGNLNLVYAYERVMPGPEYVSSLKTLPKVYGALNERSRKIYEQHLEISLPGLEHRCLPNIVSAELAKVIENSYRMANIALVSEFADFASKIGADLVGILESIRVRPTHSNIRFAGQAPGGYCLTKDPQFLFESMRVQGFHADLNMIAAAIEKSKTMNHVIIDFVCTHLDKSWATSFLGVSYRSGVGDLRESSAMELALTLLRRGYELDVVDPFVNVDEVANSIELVHADVARNYQAVLAVKHIAFNCDYLSRFKVLLDINSCLSVKERKELSENGTEVRQYGDFT